MAIILRFFPTLIILTLLLLRTAPFFTNSQVQAVHSATSVSIYNFHAASLSPNNIFFGWDSGGGYTNASIAVGTNSSDPSVNYLRLLTGISTSNTCFIPNGTQACSPSVNLGAGTYYAAMYYIAPGVGVTMISEVIEFRVSGNGNVVGVLEYTVDGSRVTFTWGSLPWSSSLGPYFLGVEPDGGSCPSGTGSQSIRPSFTDVSGGSYSWNSAGNYMACLYVYPNVPISNTVRFTLTFTPGSGNCGGLTNCVEQVNSPSSFGHGSGFVGELITRILPSILGLAGFVSLIVILISSIQFITSSGNPEAAAAARGRLMMALVGFVIIILAFAITQIVDQLFLRTDTLSD